MKLILVFVASILVGFTINYLLTGLIKVFAYRGYINEAFNRDPRPFRADQRWLLKTMMVLFWPTIDWRKEVIYYKTGKPRPPSIDTLLAPNPFLCQCDLCRPELHDRNRLSRGQAQD